HAARDSGGSGEIAGRGEELRFEDLVAFGGIHGVLAVFLHLVDRGAVEEAGGEGISAFDLELPALIDEARGQEGLLEVGGGSSAAAAQGFQELKGSVDG